MVGDDSDDDKPLLFQFKIFKGPVQAKCSARNGELPTNSRNDFLENSDKTLKDSDDDNKPLTFALPINHSEKETDRSIAAVVANPNSVEQPLNGLKVTVDAQAPATLKVYIKRKKCSDERASVLGNSVAKKLKPSSDTSANSAVSIGAAKEEEEEDASDGGGGDDDDYDIPLGRKLDTKKKKHLVQTARVSGHSVAKKPQLPVTLSVSMDADEDEEEEEEKEEDEDEDDDDCGGGNDVDSDTDADDGDGDYTDDDDYNVPLGKQLDAKRKRHSDERASALDDPRFSYDSVIREPKLSVIPSKLAVTIDAAEEEEDDDDIPLGKMVHNKRKKDFSTKESKPSVKKDVAKDEDDNSDDDDYDIPLSKHLGPKRQKRSDEKAGVSDSPRISGNLAATKMLKPPAEEEENDDDDIPLSKMLCPKRNKGLYVRTGVSGKPRTENPISKSKSVEKMDSDEEEEEEQEEDDDDYDFSPAKRSPAVAKGKKITAAKRPAASSKAAVVAAKKVLDARKGKLKKHMKKKVASKGAKKQKDALSAGGGQKWTTLEHSGVIFPPPYKPHSIRMLFNGKPVDLTPEQEEVATMFAVMTDTDYATKPKFVANFWNDWKKLLGPNHVIQELEGCDFSPIYEWSLAEKEKKKQMSTQEKKVAKEEKLKQEEKYMWALVDGVKEKVGNFRVEPPGLFRGRGEHPKMGKVKRRIFPEDIVINIGADSPVPDCPIPGRWWKEIRHDNTVTWLAYWNDPINSKEQKYVFLSPSSSLKGQSDKEKYEKARILKDYIEDIRKTYTENFTSPDPTTRQIAVATYLIDRLALRAGNEKDDDEADTVGCCSLKVEHVTLVPPKSLEFDFLGKDSIRYFNTVEVIEPVYKAIGDFKKDKTEGQDLFDRLDTSKLNAHLKNIMPQLTAKVFRTYNASITLDTLLVDTDGHLIPEKIAAYQRANKEVAVLCNHQRSVSKSHGAQMEKLEGKLAELSDLLDELQIDLERAKKGKPPGKDMDGNSKKNQNPEVLEKKISQTKQKMERMKLDMKIKEDLKTVALGTSKINYMDPRITVAWCKQHEVPIEKVFNKSLLAKFAWAMEVDMSFRF